MTLYFNCQNEATKFPVGQAQGAKTVKIAELVSARQQPRLV